MSKAIAATVLAACALAGTVAQAADRDGKLTPFVGLGLTFGGEDIATVEYTNGTNKTLSSGGLVDIQAGLEYGLTGLPVAVQATVGYHADTANARNGDMTFSRVPVEVIALYDLGNQWRLGGGVRSATSGKFTGSGDGAYTALGSSTTFKSTLGWLAEVEFKATPQLGIQARYVNESYTVDLPSKPKIDGSHFGIFGVFYFR